MSLDNISMILKDFIKMIFGLKDDPTKTEVIMSSLFLAFIIFLIIMGSL